MSEDDDTYYDDWLDEELEIDVCQHCGRHFGWTPELREAWQKHWRPGPDEWQPQRCMRCIVDDTWVD